MINWIADNLDDAAVFGAIALTCLLIFGCSSGTTPTAVIHERIEQCPVQAIDLTCPDITDASVEALEDAYIDCRAAVEAWQEAWRSCGDS